MLKSCSNYRKKPVGKNGGKKLKDYFFEVQFKSKFGTFSRKPFTLKLQITLIRIKSFAKFFSDR